jgi:membrane protease YdiL (CAAX protease family)
MASRFKAYLRETRRPVYSAALILPFLCVYHAGTIVMNTTYVNGADALINRILSSFSVHSAFGSALVLLASFTIWQLRSRASWKIKSGPLLTAFLESLCFALILLAAFGWLSSHLILAKPRGTSRLAHLVLYCGAGIYEELLFRAFLLTMLTAAFGPAFRKQRTAAVVTAAITGSLLFSAFHYVGRAGDVFSFSSFIQRTLGGLYFSALFLTRGFGVAAATHAIYDVIVGLILL